MAPRPAAKPKVDFSQPHNVVAEALVPHVNTYFRALADQKGVAHSLEVSRRTVGSWSHVVVKLPLAQRSTVDDWIIAVRISSKGHVQLFAQDAYRRSAQELAKHLRSLGLKKLPPITPGGIISGQVD